MADAPVLRGTLNASELIAELLSVPDIPSGQRWLRAHANLLVDSFPDELAQAIKNQADIHLRVNLSRSTHYAQLLIELAIVTGNLLHRALGLRALGNIKNICLREFEPALTLFDEAARIYRDAGLRVKEAEALVGEIGTLAELGRYDDALHVGSWVCDVLEENERWPQLMNAMLNVALVHNRIGNDGDALRVLDQARVANQRLGSLGDATLLLIENSRIIHLRNLGQYQAAMQAGEVAYTLATRLGYAAEAAKIEHNQAQLHITLGNFNEALRLFAHARDTLLQDERIRDVLLLDLDRIECWLQLGRYDRVLETCQQARQLFARADARKELAQTILYESVAYAGLARFREALDSIAEAGRLFERENNPLDAGVARLEAANVVFRMGDAASSLRIALECSTAFQASAAPVQYARACLVAARAAEAMGQSEQAIVLVGEVLKSIQDIPTLAYQAHYLLGSLAEAKAKPGEALAHYDRAIAEIERLRGQMMVEFRSSYIADKQDVYENAVRASVALGSPHRALLYAERAKSRALLDLLSYRLDLSIQPRSAEDQDRVKELNLLRAGRDRLYRRWESQRMELRESGQPQQNDSAIYQTLLQMEQQITDKWHDLLVRNADYAREETLWQPPTESVQPYLDRDTVLLEYFSVHDQLYAFLVSADEVRVQVLPARNSDIERWRQKLWLNFQTVGTHGHGRRSASELAPLHANANKILRQLDQLLLAPLQDALVGYRHLIVVPHGALHRVPFHALHDGSRYLIERQEVSYLPGAGLLRHIRTDHPALMNMVAFGCSVGGLLQGAVQEAQRAAGRFNGRVYVEGEATLANLLQEIGACRLIHLATHAEFRPDNPLFSYLALQDGQLTALDIFNLRLNASLVTLSACETGESAVGGGDELQGLTRAFLYAGASSLVLSGWPVEDGFTAALMDRFYLELVGGQPKGAALRRAQLNFVSDHPAADAYAHPQFWAAFSLVGDWGVL